jgi:DnaJ-class molecular chaperone
MKKKLTNLSDGRMQPPSDVECTDCGGTGLVNGEKCVACNGIGSISSTKMKRKK